MRYLFLSLLILWLCEIPLAPAMAEPQVHEISPATTSIETIWRLFGLRGGKGQFRDFSGTVIYDPDRPEAMRLFVDIALASFTSGDEERDALIRGPDFFDAGTHPYAHFEGTGLHLTGSDEAEIEGILTLRGIGEPLALDIRVAKEKGVPLHVIAEGTLDRTRYGMTRYRPFLGRRVDIRIEIRLAGED
ncbi:MAG: hypothetical protein Tsb008_17320 [Rhodothalassiaceae bacterium]